MHKYITVYKSLGETPLEAIAKFRIANPEYKDTKIAYAGRLDPMAHGKLLLLIGEECKHRDKYQALDKEYRFKVLFGLGTDTFDVLGVVSTENENTELNILDQLNETKVVKLLETLNGKFVQTYPPYSSKTVNGKPLYWWSRNNKLNEIEIPKKIVDIYNTQLLNFSTISKEELESIVYQMISKVKGDFRQEEIIDTWKSFFKSTPLNNFPVAEIKAKVSSGTYVRTIAHDLGEALKVGGIALEIERTEIYTKN